MEYLVGLDLGQLQDYSALGLLECRTPPGQRTQYDVRHLHRFRLGTPYPVVVAAVAKLMRLEALRDARLIVDATGVGLPVVQYVMDYDLDPIAVMITGGTHATCERGIHHVPKRDLVSVVSVLQQTSRLKVARSLPLARTLVEEMLAFRVKLSRASGHDTFGPWREGQHDDLIYAVALPCWYGDWLEGGAIASPNPPAAPQYRPHFFRPPPPRSYGRRQ